MELHVPVTKGTQAGSPAPRFALAHPFTETCVHVMFNNGNFILSFVIGMHHPPAHETSGLV